MLVDKTINFDFTFEENNGTTFMYVVSDLIIKDDQGVILDSNDFKTRCAHRYNNLLNLQTFYKLLERKFAIISSEVKIEQLDDLKDKSFSFKPEVGDSPFWIKREIRFVDKMNNLTR